MEQGAKVFENAWLNIIPFYWISNSYFLHWTKHRLFPQNSRRGLKGRFGWRIRSHPCGPKTGDFFFLVRILWHDYREGRKDLVKLRLLTRSPKINLVENWSQVALPSQSLFLTRQTASPNIPPTGINSRVFPGHRLGKHQANCLPVCQSEQHSLFFSKIFFHAGHPRKFLHPIRFNGLLRPLCFSHYL